MLSDLRESRQIEQDADLIMFLYREDYYDKETPNKNLIEIILTKQRNGPVGEPLSRNLVSLSILNIDLITNLGRRHSDVVTKRSEIG